MSLLQTGPGRWQTTGADQKETVRRNWLQRLVGIPFLGAWIGSAVVFVPMILAMLAVEAFARLSGTPFNFRMDANTGHGWGLLGVGLVHAAWLLALRKVMGVRLVMPVLPVPWLWVMGLFIVSGGLQLAGGSGTIRL